MFSWSLVAIFWFGVESVAFRCWFIRIECGFGGIGGGNLVGWNWLEPVSIRGSVLIRGSVSIWSHDLISLNRFKSWSVISCGTSAGMRESKNRFDWLLPKRFWLVDSELIIGFWFWLISPPCGLIRLDEGLWDGYESCLLIGSCVGGLLIGICVGGGVFGIW